jgi:hypothetical protein
MLGELQTSFNPYPIYPASKTIPAVVNVHDCANQTSIIECETDINVAAGENMPTEFCLSTFDENSYVEYGPITNGQRTWVRARIIPAVLRTGTPAAYDFPFLGHLYGLMVGRGHLLAQLFGGNGKDPHNLVPLPHQCSHLPIMEAIEKRILVYISAGNIVDILIHVNYDSANSSANTLLPCSIIYMAENARGKTILGDFGRNRVLPIRWK